MTAIFEQFLRLPFNISAHFFCFASFRNISFTARLQHNNIKRNDILHSPIHFILFFCQCFSFLFFASSTLVISIFFHLYFAMCCFFLFLFRLKLLFFSAFVLNAMCNAVVIVFVFFLFGSVFFHLCIYFHFFFSACISRE